MHRGKGDRLVRARVLPVCDNGSMIKLWEPVFRIIFHEINFALNRNKICAVSMSDTCKQQFTSNQSIYQLLDKYRSVLDDIDL